MLCMDRMIKFDVLVACSLAAAGVSVLLAYFMLNYIGSACGSITGSLIVAAGVYVLCVPADEQVFNSIDRLFWGYLVISFGTPFAVTSALDSASVIQKRPLLLLCLLFSFLELGSLLWTVWIEVFKPDSTVELFNQYLWVPSVLILCNLVIIPFSSQSPVGNVERLLERVYADFVPNNSKDYLRSCHKYLWDSLQGNVVKLKTGWFWIFAIYYTLNMMALDLFYSSGVEYAWILSEADIFKPFLEYRPVISALSVFIFYWLFVVRGVPILLGFAFVSLLSLGIQLLQLTEQWEVVSLIAGPCRVGIAALGIVYTLCIFGHDSFGIIYSCLMIVNGLGDLFLPVLDEYFWLNSVGLTKTLCYLGSITLVLAITLLLRLYQTSRRVQSQILKDNVSTFPEEPIPQYGV